MVKNTLYLWGIGSVAVLLLIKLAIGAFFIDFFGRLFYGTFFSSVGLEITTKEIGIIIFTSLINVIFVVLVLKKKIKLPYLNP